METKDIILELRTKKGLSQDELAEKVFVTRQAVSRWENGETTPNTETLKLLSKLFDVSINTLLGSPRQLICQCCGMPLEDANISKETDGFFNEEYCKWCYADGEYMYHDMDELIDVCVTHMASEEFSSEQARAYMKDMLPKLNYWKQYKNLDGADVVLEVAGAEDTFRLAWECARPNAIVTVVALYDKPQSLPLPDMYGKNLIFKTGGVDGCDCDEILSLIEHGKIDTTPLITHRFALKDIEKAYEIFENKLDGVIKIAVEN